MEKIYAFNFVTAIFPQQKKSSQNQVYGWVALVAVSYPSKLGTPKSFVVTFWSQAYHTAFHRRIFIR